MTPAVNRKPGAGRRKIAAIGSTKTVYNKIGRAVRKKKTDVLKRPVAASGKKIAVTTASTTDTSRTFHPGAWRS
jgi:hypothetical protein